MDEYKIAVEVLASTKSDYVFRNSSPAHASIVLSTMIKYSECEFRIYDDNLSGDIADLNEEFYLNLEEFIKAKKVLKIVIDTIKSKESRIFSTLSQYKIDYPETVFISTASEQFKNKVYEVHNKPLNFALGDNRAFRIEDVISDDEPSRIAICCFNNTKITSKLLSAFDAEFSSCISI